MIPSGALNASVWRITWWILVGIVCTVLTAFALRGYLDPAALIDFANARLC
jgi:hypothetical protein